MSEAIEIGRTQVLLPGFAEMAAAVESVAARHGSPVVWIGALARDLILSGVYDETPRRATRDGDAAVRVESWDAYAAFRDALVRDHEFVVGDGDQRLVSPQSVMLDLVPHGGVAPDGALRWPPDGTPELSTTGLSAALEGSVRLRLPGGVVVRVASLIDQILLKIVSWSDRPAERAKDAEDLRTLLLGYGHTRSRWVYDGHEDLLDQGVYDLQEAVARIAGRHAQARLAVEPGALHRVHTVVSGQVGLGVDAPLVLAMSPHAMSDDRAKGDLGLLEAFHMGLVDPR